MKRTALASTLILGLLSSAVAATQLVRLGTANFMVETWNSSPVISINSPTNGTYVKDALLDFTITKPDDWLVSMSWYWGRSYIFSQELQNVSYQVDGRFIESLNANSKLSSPFNYSVNLMNLTDGAHSLVVYAFASGFQYYYKLWGVGMPSSLVVNSSSTVHFTLDTISPSVTLLSLGNGTRHITGVPLCFGVNEPVAQIAYSLDGERNITITENTTLPGLDAGEHNLTVYAHDYAGNVGASETIYFSTEPFPTVMVIAASGVSAAVIGVGLLVYFRKHRAGMGDKDE